MSMLSWVHLFEMDILESMKFKEIWRHFQKVQCLHMLLLITAQCNAGLNANFLKLALKVGIEPTDVTGALSIFCNPLPPNFLAFPLILGFYFWWQFEFQSWVNQGQSSLTLNSWRFFFYIWSKLGGKKLLCFSWPKDWTAGIYRDTFASQCFWVGSLTGHRLLDGGDQWRDHVFFHKI